jgi:predicted nucleic acid-binding Zn ribbon protein
LQRTFLALLTHAAENGEVPKLQVAFLTDRIRFNEDKPQVYGTVLDWDENGELSCVVEDPAHLDARRRAVGLPAAQDDLEASRKAVEAEGGRAPPDFAEARRQRLAWAKRVGWIDGE